MGTVVEYMTRGRMIYMNWVLEFIDKLDRQLNHDDYSKLYDMVSEIITNYEGLEAVIKSGQTGCNSCKHHAGPRVAKMCSLWNECRQNGGAQLWEYDAIKFEEFE